MHRVILTTRAAQFELISQEGEWTLAQHFCFLDECLEKESVTPPLSLHSALLSVLSLTPTQYYPNQRRKFFLNLDDKDILEIYGNDFLWNGIQTQLQLLL